MACLKYFSYFRSDELAIIPKASNPSEPMPGTGKIPFLPCWTRAECTARLREFQGTHMALIFLGLSFPRIKRV